MGIKSLELMNEAFLLKLLWRLFSDPNALWVKVMLGKYGRQGEEGRKLIAKPTDSRLCSEMIKLWEVFSTGRGMEIKNRQVTKVWTDKWVRQEEKLISYIPENAMIDRNMKVCELIDGPEGGT